VPGNSLHSIGTVKKYVQEHFYFYAYVAYRPAQFLAWLGRREDLQRQFKFFSQLFVSSNGELKKKFQHDFKVLLFGFKANNWVYFENALLSSLAITDLMALLTDEVASAFYDDVISHPLLSLKSNEKLGDDDLVADISGFDLFVEIIYEKSAKKTPLTLVSAFDSMREQFFAPGLDMFFSIDSIEAGLAGLNVQFGFDWFVRCINKELHYLLVQDDLRARQLMYLTDTLSAGKKTCRSNGEYQSKLTYLLSCIYVERWVALRGQAEKLIAQLDEDCRVYQEYLTQILDELNGALSYNDEVRANKILLKIGRLSSLRQYLSSSLSKPEVKLARFLQQYSSKETQFILRAKTDSGWIAFFRNIARTLYRFFWGKPKRCSARVVNGGLWSRPTESICLEQLEVDCKPVEQVFSAA
jgi:hypothetical protein